MNNCKEQRAFTLVELLVVIAIIGILSSVVYTNLSEVRERARISAGARFDSSTLHSIGDQLIGEWLFDTNASPTPDTSGFSNSGTLSGSVSWQTSGGYDDNGAYLFTGANPGILTTFSLSKLNTKNWTISAWVTSGNPSAGSIWFIGESSGGNFLWGKIAGQNSLRMVINGCGDWFPIPGTAIFDGKYHHIILENANGVLKVYVDGVFKSSYGSACLPTNTSNMYIGRRTGGEFWNGYIDNVRIYSSALSGSEIQKLYAEGMVKNN